MINQVTIIGNLTRDIEVKQTPSGVAYTQFTIAVNNKHGEEEEAYFFDVTAWRSTAEFLGKYAVKGAKLCVVGSLQQHSWEDQDGNKRTKTSIQANQVELLTPKEDKAEAPKKKPTVDPIEEDDIPF